MITVYTDTLAVSDQVNQKIILSVPIKFLFAASALAYFPVRITVVLLNPSAVKA